MPDVKADDKDMTIAEVAVFFGVHTRTIENWYKRKEMNFPRPVEYSPRCLRWSTNEVVAWRKSKRKAAK